MITALNPDIDPGVLIELRRGASGEALAEIGHGKIPDGTPERVMMADSEDIERELGRLTQLLSSDYAASVGQEAGDTPLSPDQDARFDRLHDMFNATEIRNRMGLDALN